MTKPEQPIVKIVTPPPHQVWRISARLRPTSRNQFAQLPRCCDDMYPRFYEETLGTCKTRMHTNNIRESEARCLLSCVLMLSMTPRVKWLSWGRGASALLMQCKYLAGSFKNVYHVFVPIFKRVYGGGAREGMREAVGVLGFPWVAQFPRNFPRESHYL